MRSVLKYFIGIFLFSFILVAPLSSAAYADDAAADSEFTFTCSTSVCAAYSSQGLRILGNLIDSFGVDSSSNTFVRWGAFIFSLALISALVMMALGQSPKNYAWFMLGPALFYYFIGITEDNFKAVEWKIGKITQEQKYVYRQLNPAITDTEGIGYLSGDKIDEAPEDTVVLPHYIVLLDSIVSATVGSLVSIFLPDSIEGAEGTSRGSKWYLLSNSKWPLLETLTATRLQSNDFREMLTVFMASECGDVLAEQIDTDSFAMAGKVKDGAGLPATVFRASYDEIGTALSAKKIPMPYSFRQMLKNKPLEVLSKFITEGGDNVATIADNPIVDCASLLGYVMDGFLYESRQFYFSLPKTMPLEGALDPIEIADPFFNGWAIEPDGDGLVDIYSKSPPEMDIFMSNFIMAYMFRNEIMLVPLNTKQSLLPGQKPEVFAEKYHAAVGGKNKYGEFYTWSLLMPYLQGLLLYVLAIGYPIVCLMLIFPGHFKWVITWTTFYVWAKFWDVGFAIVANIERSVWASVGNSPEIGRINGKIFELDKYDKVVVKADFPRHDYAKLTSITHEDLAITSAVELFDKTLTLSQALSHDLQNSFYIYLMSALYFAVPAVTGQLILGSKAGAASILTGAIQGVQGEGGSAAKAGATGELNNVAGLNAATMQQTALAKGHRESGFAAQAMASKNLAQKAQMQNMMLQGAAKQRAMRAEQYGAISQMQDLQNNYGQSLYDLGATFLRGGGLGANHLLGNLSKYGKAYGNLYSPQGGSNDSATTEFWLRQIAAKLEGPKPPARAAAGENEAEGANSAESSNSNGAQQLGGAGGTAGAFTGGGGRKAAGRVWGSYWNSVKSSMGEGNGGEPPKASMPEQIASNLAPIHGQFLRQQEIDSSFNRKVDQLEASGISRYQGMISELQGAGMQGTATGMNERASRLSASAKFSSEESAYRQMAAASQQLVGTTAAMGISAGTFAPKGRPMDEGSLGAGGQLGQDYSNEFAYFGENQGYFTELNEGLSQMGSINSDMRVSAYMSNGELTKALDINNDMTGVPIQSHIYNSPHLGNFGVATGARISNVVKGLNSVDEILKGDAGFTEMFNNAQGSVDGRFQADQRGKEEKK